LGAGRETALPLVLVHEKMLVPGAATATAAQIRWLRLYLEGKPDVRQHFARMGASRSAMAGARYRTDRHTVRRAIVPNLSKKRTDLRIHEGRLTGDSRMNEPNSGNIGPSL
jgi:hypothetical protein